MTDKHPAAGQARRPAAATRLRRHRAAAAALGAALPGTGLAGWAEQFSPRTGWPEDLRRAPLIIDTDIGGDPDDTLALAAAALTVPELALVITCDETGPPAPGQRARLARALLDLAGRPTCRSPPDGRRAAAPGTGTPKD